MSNVLFWGEALSTARTVVGGVDYMVNVSLQGLHVITVSSLSGLPGT